ncbi:MAG: hypothetical protein ACLUE2_08995 [Bacteroides cellulosilyticus]
MNTALQKSDRYSPALIVWQHGKTTLTELRTDAPMNGSNDGIEPAIDHCASMTIEAGSLGSTCSKKTISSVRLIFIHLIPLLLRCL